MLELKIQNLQELISRQEIEISELKQQTEAANKKSQELAVKVVEGSSKNWREDKKSEDKKTDE